MVIDYRELNQGIIDEPFEIPRIYENLQLMGNSRYFTKIDLKNGFNQIPIDYESSKLTGFILFNQIYTYNRIPFGIKSGPKIFQNCISNILNKVRNCFVYIDDIVVFGESKKEHDKQVEKVLDILKEHTVRINFEKSFFRQKEIKLLGYIVNEEGIKLDTKYLSNKIFTKEIRTKKDLQRLLGILNWYRRFIKVMSEKCLKLSNLLKLETFDFTEDIKNTIIDLQEEIKKSKMLKYPDFSKKFVLECDASNKGIGAVLYQEKGVIGYYSKKLNETELNYSIVEKEMFAMIKALIHFSELIQGYYVEIYTDNRNCTFLKSNLSNRMQRWILLMNAFNYEVMSIKGGSNNIADAISRSYIVKEVQIKTERLKRRIRRWCNFANIDSDERYIIEDKFAYDFLKYIHKKSAHAGINACYYNIKRYYYVNNIGKKLKKVIEDCKKCKLNKKDSKRDYPKIKISSKDLWETVCSDIFGPFSLEEFDIEGSKNKGYLISITDVYSRFTLVRFTTDIKSETLIKTFKIWCKKYQCPKVLISDNGKNYISKKFKRFIGKSGIKHNLVPPYTPSSNGISERLNQTFAEIIRMYKKKGIKKILKKINQRVNQNYLTSIKNIPQVIVSGYNMFNPSGRKEIHQEKEIKELQEVERFEKYKIGDKVYVRKMNADKLESQYEGPYVITQVSRRGLWIRVERRDQWYHVKNIKR